MGILKKEYECYKVVSIYEDGAIMSAIIDEPTLRVEYEVGEFVRPGKFGRRGYGLLAFSNEWDAISFCDTNDGNVVYKAAGRGPIDCAVYKRHDTAVTEHFEITIGDHLAGEWVRGTVMYKEIKLLEKVWG